MPTLTFDTILMAFAVLMFNPQVCQLVAGTIWCSIPILDSIWLMEYDVRYRYWIRYDAVVVVRLVCLKLLLLCFMRLWRCSRGPSWQLRICLYFCQARILTFNKMCGTCGIQCGHWHSIWRRWLRLLLCAMLTFIKLWLVLESSWCRYSKWFWWNFVCFPVCCSY